MTGAGLAPALGIPDAPGDPCPITAADEDLAKSACRPIADPRDDGGRMRLHTRSLAVVATMVVGCGGASDDARLDARGGDAGEPDAQPDAPTDAHVDAPTDAPPGVSIASIQDGTLPTGTAVRVNGAAVTGVDATGFMAQDPDVPGGLYAGVYVDTGGAPAVPWEIGSTSPERPPRSR